MTFQQWIMLPTAFCKPSWTQWGFFSEASLEMSQTQSPSSTPSDFSRPLRPLGGKTHEVSTAGKAKVLTVLLGTSDST